MSDFDSFGSAASFMEHFGGSEGSATINSPTIYGFESPFDSAETSSHISHISPLTRNEDPTLLSDTSSSSSSSPFHPQALPKSTPTTQSHPITIAPSRLSYNIDGETGDSLPAPSQNSTSKGLRRSVNGAEMSGALQLSAHQGSITVTGMSLSSPPVSPLTMTGSNISSQHSTPDHQHPSHHSQGLDKETGSGNHLRRDAHMASEQRRRAIMRDSFERLQQLLPPSEYRKPSKANLLQAAVSYISYLKQQDVTLRTRLQWLAQEKAILLQQIQSGVNVQAFPATTVANAGAPLASSIGLTVRPSAGKGGPSSALPLIPTPTTSSMTGTVQTAPSIPPQSSTSICHVAPIAPAFRRSP